MKLLYFTDPHLTTRIPRSRTDDYPQAILAKLREVFEVAQGRGADVVLCGGDLFDTPRVSPRLAGELAAMLRALPVPFYVVLGNHDTFGQNPETWPQTELGILVRAGLVRLLDRERVIEQDGLRIEGQPYFPGIDDDAVSYRMGGDRALRILAAHGMLVPSAPEGMAHTPVVSIGRPEEGWPHLILVGHYHPGFVEKQSGSLVLNPGALARTDAGLDNLSRAVQMAWVVLHPASRRPITYELLPVRTARPAVEVLTRDHLDRRRAQARAVLAFHEKLHQLVRSTDHFEAALQRVMRSVSERVQQAVRHALDQAEKEEGASKTVDLDVRVAPLAHVRLENFQSHADTRLDLDRHLNAIVGPSDQGKSAILRAIWWVLYNEPKGKAIEAAIRVGESSVAVELGYVSGQRVLRRRSKSKAGSGEYVVYPPEGENHEITEAKVKRFTGFGDTIPPDVVRVTGAVPVPIARDVRRVVHFHRQHDPYFLLSESPSVQASALAYLAGAERGDSALRILTTATGQLRRERKARQQELEDLAGQLQRFADLEDEKRRLEAWRARLDAIKGHLERMNRLVRLQELYAKTVEDERRAQQVLRDLSNLDMFQARLEQARAVYVRLHGLRQLAARLRRVEEQVAWAASRMSRLAPVIMQADERVAVIARRVAVYRELRRIQSEYTTLAVKVAKARQAQHRAETILKYEPRLARAGELVVRRQLLLRLQQAYEPLRQRFAQAYEHRKAQEAIIAQVRAQMEELWRKSGFCPVCRRPMSAEDVHRVLEGVEA